MKKFKILFLIILMMVGVTYVDAATFTKGTTKIYYGSNYTYYNKKINGAIAYCIQMNRKVPANGYTGYSSGWSRYKYDSFVSAQIIKIGREKYSGKNEYLYIQEALNCFKTYNGYYSGACGNSKIKNLISSAKEAVKTYNYESGKSTSTLPSISFASDNSRLTRNSNGVYVSKAVNLNGMVATYGGSSDKTTYIVNVTSSVGTAYMCPSTTYNNDCKTSVTIDNGKLDAFYVVVLNGGNNGGKVTLKASGSNSSNYPASYLWKAANSNYQRMVTYTDVDINRSIDTTMNFNYSAPSTYEASLEKVDENGNLLKGANLVLYTAKDEAGTDKIKDICTISGDSSSCSKKNLIVGDGNGYENNNYLCYEEKNSPNGYKKINKTKCSKIILGATVSYYYNGDDAITEGEYNKYNGSSKYCVTNPNGEVTDEYINKVIANGIENNSNLTVGECEVVEGSTIELEDSDGADGENKPTRKEICLAGDKKYYSDKDYCTHKELTKFEETDGSYSLVVSNVLNSVNISKKSITSKDEIPGARLSIYTTNTDGSCSNVLAKAKKFGYVDNVLSGETNETDNGGESTDDAISDSSDNSSTTDDADTGNESANIEEGNNDIEDPAKNGLSWVSSFSPAVIYGITPGTYCLVEEIAPKGYKKVTSTVKFSIDIEGNTKLIDGGGKNVSDLEVDGDKKSTVTIYNETTKLSISKTDIATGKELPGATISICDASKNEAGEYEMAVNNAGDCSAVSLADGTLATWVSTDKPKEIFGLGAGTYYLVENIAPTDYSTAESILFTLKEDGTLVDINGKSLKDNKLVMKDKKLDNVKTGNLTAVVVIGIVVVMVIVGLSSYYVLCYKRKNTVIKNTNNDLNEKKDKVRKRKVRK